MSSIQEIRALEERIYDIVQDYVDGNYNPDDVLAIGRRCGRITLTADAKDNIKPGKTTEFYALQELTRKGDDGKLEPDTDKISKITSTWLFIE